VRLMGVRFLRGSSAPIWQQLRLKHLEKVEAHVNMRCVTIRKITSIFVTHLIKQSMNAPKTGIAFVIAKTRTRAKSSSPIGDVER